MKKLILQPGNFTPKLWLLFHAGLVSAFLIAAAAGVRYSIDTSLFDILPSFHTLRSAADADKALSERTGRIFSVLCSSDDFAAAKDGAEKVYTSVKDDSAFESVSLYFDNEMISRTADFIYEHRYQLLDAPAIAQISSDAGAKQFAQNALASAFSAFTVSPLDHLDSDPFMLTEYGIKKFISKAASSGTAISVKDSVLAMQKEGKWYVLLRGSLSEEGAALTNKSSGIRKIYTACSAAEHDNSAIRYIYSGIPFHSYESSSSAQREISIISTVSMIAVIVILIYIFRSLEPVFFSICAIIISLVLGLCTTLLLFHSIHILTFVFGTTLIGTCFDYSVHFFINWKTNLHLSDGNEIRSHLFRGLTISLISTEICYAVLMAAPFTLLRQVGVFCFTGILSTYLTTVCLYPRLKLPAVRYSAEIDPFLNKLKLPAVTATKKFRSWFLAVAAVCAAIIFIPFHKNIRIDNNISTLYTMKGHLLSDEKQAASILNYGSSGWYYIVKGTTEEDVLEKEFQLTRKLDNLMKDSPGSSYLALTQFIPPVSMQEKSYAAAGKLIALAPQQYQALGFSGSLSDDLNQAYQRQALLRLLPDNDMPDSIKQMMSQLWIGNIGKNWYTAVIPLHVHNETEFRSLAADSSSIFFINKTKDISTQLDTLSRIMLLLLVLSYAGIIVLLRMFYPPKTTLFIACIPAFVMMVTLSVLAVCDIPLGFFSITGIILIFGLGLDYIIYTVENSRKIPSKSTTVAIAVSFITTALSFGALALSTFAPVHIFGITVFAGLSAAYICAIFSVI